MGEDVEELKQRLPLLEYLRQQNWTGRPVSHGGEWVGPCPLHSETRPSFYVNVRKNLFYCHGCGHGGDLIRFVELSLNLSFCGALVHLKQQLRLPEPGEDEALREAVDFYEQQLSHHDEAMAYLHSRGVHDGRLIKQLSIGYAPGGMLYRHMSRLGYSTKLLLQVGLIHQAKDAFYRRIVFPCFDGSRPANLYGRSIGGAAPHRFLPRPKGTLYAWSTVQHHTDVILVEGLFDLAVLWQAGFVNTTCSLGTHLTPGQFRQLCDRPRTVYLTFDVDANGSGQQAAQELACRLRAQGLTARRVLLPSGHDPNSFFVQGGDAHQFHTFWEAAQL
jgi:DNA primase